MSTKLNHKVTDAEYLRWLASIELQDGCEINAAYIHTIAEELERLKTLNADLLAALEDLLIYANNYSDFMAETHGRGAAELGTYADSVSVAGMARKAIAAATPDAPE